MVRPDDAVDPTLTPEEVGATAPDTAPGDARARAALSLPGYELGGTIGRGGMGEVVAAHDPRIGREVAVKTLRGAGSPELVDRFLREAKIQGRLDHPAIVPVHEIGHDAAGQPYFTMKRLRGETLADVLARGDAPLSRLLRAFVDVCLAVEFAHERRFVHRDLKPTNIMLGGHGEVYVLDWGIARSLGDAAVAEAGRDLSTLEGHTQAGALLGTPGYMAPEQAQGAGEAREPADVYALGAILFELLAGEPLHPRGAAALATTIATPTASPARRAPGRAIPPELDDACTAALAEDPAARPSARELADRVQRYLDGDRDLEQRRALAATLVAAARAALASSDPARQLEGARDASRALALDPASTDAAALVAQVMFQPPGDDPPELAAELAAHERRLDRERSRRISWIFVMLVACLALLGLRAGVSWTVLAAIASLAIALAGMFYVNARGPEVPLGWRMVGGVVLIVAFSRIAGELVLTPVLVAVYALTFATHRRASRTPWMVVVWAAVAVVVPFALEAAGVLASTWHMTAHGMLVWGTVVGRTTATDGVLIIGANIGMVLIPALLATSITRDRHEAQRALHRREWRLRRLVPTIGG